MLASSNRRVICNFGVGLLLTIACLVRFAAAGPFSQLVIFGDSLSDVGNISQATFGTVPGRYYQNGRFSNGPVFTEALSVGLGLGQTIRSTAGGNNFAYGGAQTTGTGGFEGFVIRDIDEQVDQFLANRTVDPGALFLVYAGANDLLGGGQTNVNIPVNNIAAEIGQLIAAGARDFLVPNLPLLGFTPRYNTSPTASAQYNARSGQFNDALDAALDVLGRTNDVSFHRLDVATLFSEALADPAAFGLINVTDAAAPGLSPGALSYDTSRIASNPNQYLFWDDVHPTAAVHAFLAERALDLLLHLDGDYNEDGTVDAADYTVWRDSQGQTGAALAADGDRNGIVDQADYNTWKDNFGGSSSISLSSHSSSVPEPSATALILLVLTLIGTARTRT